MVGLLQYLPNADAARFMASEILPRVQRALPEATLDIVGGRPPDDLAALGRRPGVQVPGFVDELQSYYRRASVLVVPLRAGSGVRQKIIEAMALGRPVVSTTLGAEGLGVRDGEHLLVADTPADFAAAVVRLCREPALVARLTGAARAFVEADHGLSALQRAVRAVYPVAP
jgi:glycosyltransferase involved in cell wall biosynthesis